MGRHTKYDPSNTPRLARKLAEKGVVDSDIARALRVSPATFYTWQKRFPEFLEALKKGKKKPDAAVEASLYQRAVGYNTLVVTSQRIDSAGRRGEEHLVKTVTKHIPADPTSIIFWLKNRMPKEWRDHPHLRHDKVALNDDPFEGVPSDKRAEALERFRKAFPRMRFGPDRRTPPPSDA